jgi:uncharacterized protein (DUF58 family)
MRPTLRAILLLACAIPVALLPVFGSEALVVVWVGFVGLAALAIGMDGLLAPGRSRLTLRASAPATMALGSPGTLDVTVDATRALTGARVEVSPTCRRRRPAALVAVGVRLGSAVASFPLVPRRRGTFRVEAVWAWWRGPLGLLERRVRVPVDAPMASCPTSGPCAAALRFSPRVT